MEIKKINESEFEEKVLKSTKPVIVDFFATWCGPCAMQAPILEDLYEEHSAEYDFYKMDVDENMNIASKYSIESIPTLISFRGGNAMNVAVGVQTAESILKMLEI